MFWNLATSQKIWKEESLTNYLKSAIPDIT